MKPNLAKNLKAVILNCTIKTDVSQSHTQKLINRVAGVLEAGGAEVEHIHALSHTIAFGMVKDASDSQADEYPQLHQKVMAADIVILASPIWLGVKSSVATQVIERMYAYSGDRNDKGQYLYYGKTGGVITTGNEDGAKACAMDMLYALSHIGFTIPPQADCTWLGEAGPGPSYGDTSWNDKDIDPPAGYNNDFTNRNATIMAWNLLHTATMLKNNNGIPAYGNVADDWQSVPNATDYPQEGL